jgi:hypothetical protein
MSAVDWPALLAKTNEMADEHPDECGCDRCFEVWVMHVDDTFEFWHEQEAEARGLPAEVVEDEGFRARRAAFFGMIVQGLPADSYRLSAEIQRDMGVTA